MIGWSLFGVVVGRVGRVESFENANSGAVGNLVQAGRVDQIVVNNFGSGELPVPRMLPADPENFGFFNRVSELDELDGLAEDAAQAGRLLVVLLSGMVGIGKTLAALRWAHSHQHEFDGGVFVGDLRGSDPGQARSASEVLGEFLGRLGVPGPALPTTEQERAAAFREITAGRRILVILDDAATASQVQALLPSSPTSVVLVTSRHELTFVRNRIHRIRVAPFDAESAAALLTDALGDRADPETLARLGEACGCHPMALQVAASVLRDRVSIGSAVDRLLADPLGRLEIDGERFLSTAFELGYGMLGNAEQRAYRLLGLHPAPEFSLHAAAALLDVAVDDAEDVLTALARASLVEPQGLGRYRSHALLRRHGRSKLTASDDERSALRRLVEHYHDFAMARDVVISQRRRLSDRYEQVDRACDSAEQALGELSAEREALIAMVGVAADTGLQDRAWQLCETLFPFLNDRGHLADMLEIHRIGVRAAEALGDRAAQVRMLSQHGSALFAAGELDAAQKRFAEAYEVAGDTDAWGKQSAIEWQGLVHERRGDLTEALACFEASREVVRTRFDTDRRSRPLGLYRMHSGRVLVRAGRAGEAVARLREAFDFFTCLGEVANSAKSALPLSQALLRLGDPSAEEWATTALELARRGRMALDQAEALDVLAEISARSGDVQAAADRRREAFEIRAVLGVSAR